MTLVSKKIRTLDQACSSDPDQGAYRTVPGQRPVRGAAQALLLYIQELFELRLVVSEEAVLDARASIKLYCFRGQSKPRFLYLILLQENLVHCLLFHHNKFCSIPARQ